MVAIYCFRLALGSRLRYLVVIVIIILKYIGTVGSSWGLLLLVRDPPGRRELFCFKKRIVVKLHVTAIVVRGIRGLKREANR